MGGNVAGNQDKADELEDRLIDFGVRILAISDALPKTRAGRHVSEQILRCGTSPAPNYSEARAAESRADFIHKVKIVAKELNESTTWIKMISRRQMIKPTRLGNILDENQQLCGSSRRPS